jgi:hypothetical protein
MNSSSSSSDIGSILTLDSDQTYKLEMMKSVGVLGPKAGFGELALMDPDNKRSASIKCMNNC